MLDSLKNNPLKFSLDQNREGFDFRVPEGFFESQERRLKKIPETHKTGRVIRFWPVYALSSAAAAIAILLVISFIQFQTGKSGDENHLELVYNYLLNEHALAQDPFLQTMIYDIWMDEDIDQGNLIDLSSDGSDVYPDAGIEMEEATEYLLENADYDDLINSL